MSQYQVDLTLCRLSAIAISKHVWRNSSLKAHLITCVERDTFIENEMSPPITKVMDDFFVPDAAKEVLNFALRAMGKELWDLLERYKPRNDEILFRDDVLETNVGNCMDHVCWTVSGCVDEPATLRSLYFAGFLGKNASTWSVLSRCFLEDCLNDLWPKLPHLEKRGLIRPSGFRRAPITAHYWIMRLGCDVEFGINELRVLMNAFYDDAYSIEENIFMHVFSFGRTAEVKYFWEVLDENQRARVIVNVWEQVTSNEPDPPGSKHTITYKKLFFSNKPPQASGELLMFFLRQLSHYGHEDKIIRLLGSGSALAALLEWPYDNLFMKTLRESLTRHDSINYGPIMSRIVGNLYSCDEYEVIDVDAKYRRMFCVLWKMNPKNFKDSINYVKDLQMLWESGDIQLLNHILRDEELKDRRKDLLNILAMECRRAKADRSFLLKFLKQVLVPGEEREWFIRQGEVTLQDEEINVDVGILG